MILREDCPRCGSTHHKRNGHVHNGKQNHRCKACGRQFVGQFEQRRVSAEHRALIERLLKERLSLRGICRAVGVGMKWLMGFLVRCYRAAPVHLNVQSVQRGDSLLVHALEAEADALCSFVGKKANKQWLWLALDARSRQVLAFHVGEKQLQQRAAVMGQAPSDLSPIRDLLHGRLCALWPAHSQGAAPADHQGGPDHQSPGAF